MVTSVGTLGSAPFSVQQPASDRQGPRITSANIVDGEVRNQDLADDAVTSDKIRDGGVQAEDLDPSIQIGGETPSFILQVTERSNTLTIPEDGFNPFTVGVQCNSDEVVTGGGYNTAGRTTSPMEMRKQDNGWVTVWNDAMFGDVYTVYAECLKIVNE